MRFSAVLVLLVGGMYQKLVELTSQIAYLQDTTNIILADVGGMESTITQTLQEENGMVEHYSIRMTDMDFAANTCEVSVYMIPKEYTDKTAISVFFGTKECQLERDGYAYTGAVTLPLGRSFDGNLTFLFADGKKKNTEVYSNYDGIRTYLEDVLSAGMQGTPKYADGQFTLDGEVSFALDGHGQYEFDRFELAALWNGEEVWTQEITEQTLAEEEPSANPLPDPRGELTTEAMGPANPVSELPLSALTGSFDFTFSYEPSEAGQLWLCLRAVSSEGYRFEYDLLHADVVEKESEDGDENSDDGEAGEESREPVFELDEESVDQSVSYVVYDKKGGKRVIQ